MMRTLVLSLAVATTGLFMAGCTSAGEDFSARKPQVATAPDSVSAMIADAATRASTALETLAAVEYSRAPAVSMTPIGDAPSELRRAVTINWVGPVDSIVKTLADRAGYGFLTIGSTPPVPVVVSLDVENMPIIDVLRDVGLQLGMRGDVKVDGQRRMVEIHYAPNTGVSH